MIASEAGSVYDTYLDDWVECTSEERIAVGWTALNRLGTNIYGIEFIPRTIEQVIFPLDESWGPQYAYWATPVLEISEIATQLLKGEISDPTGGATHFFSPINMPKEGEASPERAGGLHYVPPPSNIPERVLFPSWAATPHSFDDECTGYAYTCESDTHEWTGNLEGVRNDYFMFYRQMIPEIRAVLQSPGELRVYDSQGRVTGLVNGEIREEIPNSMYYVETKSVMISPATDSYRYEIAGTNEGTYGLGIISVKDGSAIIFEAIDIPTSPDAVHKYTIDWDALPQGQEGAVLDIDADDDGIFEQVVTADNDLTYNEFALQTETTVDFDISLAGCWTMDDSAVDTKVLDSSGNGNHGRAQRATDDLHTTGVIDGALAFNGSSDYIDCGNRNSLDIAESISVSAWVNPYSPNGTIISKRTYLGEPLVQYLLDFDNNNLRFVWYNGGWKGVYHDAIIATNQWLHVACTYDADSDVVALYVNGIQVASGEEESGLLSNAVSVMIGAWHNGVTAVDLFEGAIDQVLIFDRALSQEELEALYLEGVITPVPPSALSESLNTSLGFTTGGSADWFVQNTTSYYGADAAQSGGISHDEDSWMQTTVSGKGTVKFYWKVSSEEYFDFLEFYIDGMLQEKISGSVNWQRKTYTISTLGSHTLEWRYMKDRSADRGSDCGWLDKVEWVATP